MNRNAIFVLLLAGAVGLIQYNTLVFCWGYIAMYSPLPQWLLSVGLSGAGLRLALVPIDFLVSVILSLPAAFLLTKLRPRFSWWLLLVAVVPPFIWANRTLFGSGGLRDYLLSGGWLSELFALIIAVVLLGLLRRNRSVLGAGA
jgi:hypothetical protein